MSETLNANPTIRNLSDLPTRSRHTLPSSSSSTSTSPSAPLGLFASTVPPSAYEPDPFNPHPSSPTSSTSSTSSSSPENDYEPIDAQEIYDLIAPIADPEHPLTLGSLSVVNLPDIHLSPLPSPSSSHQITVVTVLITPTITHCSLATVIGLGVRVRLEGALPPRFRVDVRIKEGTHSTAEQVNRQLGDKERVAAALENGTLVGVIRKMLKGADAGGETAL